MRGATALAAALILAPILVLAGLAAPALAQEELALAKVMTGRFSSARQAAEDPDYQAVELNVTPIWGRRGDGPWLYVEQAFADSPSKPYRQRIYQLRYAPQVSGVELRVFTLPDPAAAVGAWKDPTRLGRLRPEELTRLEGCEVLFSRRGEYLFRGSTQGEGCRNSHRGAAYMTSEMVVEPAMTRIWDRGYSAERQQVWGPKAGSYRFDKVAIGDVPVETPR